MDTAYIVIIIGAVTVFFMVGLLPWCKRGRNSGGDGFFPWTGGDDSDSGSNHGHSNAAAADTAAVLMGAATPAVAIAAVVTAAIEQTKDPFMTLLYLVK